MPDPDPPGGMGGMVGGRVPGIPDPGMVEPRIGGKEPSVPNPAIRRVCFRDIEYCYIFGT